MKAPANFLVARVTPSATGNEGFVVGRCVAGMLMLKAQIRTIYHITALPQDNYRVVKGAERPIELEVVSIEAYGHLLDHLDHGMTARLGLRGGNVAAVAEDDILVCVPPELT